MSIPRHEQETTVTYNRVEDIAYLSTSNDTVMRKWVKQGYVLTPHTFEGEAVRWTAQVPAKMVKFGKVNGKPRATPKTAFKPGWKASKADPTE